MKNNESPRLVFYMLNYYPVANWSGQVVQVCQYSRFAEKIIDIFKNKIGSQIILF